MTAPNSLALSLVVSAIAQTAPASGAAEPVDDCRSGSTHCAAMTSTLFSFDQRKFKLLSVETESDKSSAGVAFPTDHSELLKTFAIEEPSMAAQPGRLTSKTVKVEDVQERSNCEGPFADFSDYVTRGLVNVPTKVRTYKATRHTTEIAIADSYADELDDASAALVKRIAAKDVPALLDQMPNSTYFNRIWISDNRNPEDDWVTQTYFPKTEQNPHGFISDMSMTDGQMSTYMAEKTDYLRRNGLHEWSHQLRYHFWNAPLRTGFDDAVNLEMLQWSPSVYAGRSNGEQWAVLGERLLSTDAGQFLEAAEKAPMRSVLYMEALMLSLEEVPWAARSVNHEAYRLRAQYVLQTILPKAIEKSEAMSTSEPTEFLRNQAKGIHTYLSGLQPKLTEKHVDGTVHGSSSKSAAA